MEVCNRVLLRSRRATATRLAMFLSLWVAADTKSRAPVPGREHFVARNFVARVRHARIACEGVHNPEWPRLAGFDRALPGEPHRHAGSLVLSKECEDAPAGVRPGPGHPRGGPRCETPVDERQEILNAAPLGQRRATRCAALRAVIPRCHLQPEPPPRMQSRLESPNGTRSL